MNEDLEFYNSLSPEVKEAVDRHVCFVLNIISKRIAATADVTEKAIDITQSIINHKLMEQL